MLPPPSCHPQISREIKKIKTNKLTKTNKQTKKTDKQTNKKSHQLWRQNLWLWAVALHICYRCLTLSLTTVDSWLAGVICEIVNPQRPDQIGCIGIDKNIIATSTTKNSDSFFQVKLKEQQNVHRCWVKDILQL